MVSSYCGQYLLIAYTLLMIIECLVSLELKSLHVPAYVAVGTSVQLSCRWKLGPGDILYAVKWYKDGQEFFRHVPRNLEPRRKFILPGVNVEIFDSSGSSVLLSPVVFETAGRYRCEVSGERPHFHTVSDYADMSIVDLPHQGPVISGLRSKYRLGDRVHVICTSGLSRPACELQWYINGEQVPNSAVLSPVYQECEEKRKRSILQLDFRLTEEHFREKVVKIKCLATLATLYWQSNEKSAFLERMESHEKIILNVKKTKNRRNSSVHTNLGKLVTSASENIVFALIFISFGRLSINM